MSSESTLDELIAEFADSVQKIDGSTKNISSATNRLSLEIKKGQDIKEKYNLADDKCELAMQCVQQIINVCNNLFPATDSTKASGSFSTFKKTVSSHLEQAEKELLKLNSLKDTIDEISIE